MILKDINSMSTKINLLEEGSELNLQFEKRGGILPVIVQESSTGEVLMVAYINQQALSHTIRHKEAAFWSTSRNELWIKGMTTGNRMSLDEILVDCDQDAVLYKVTLTAGGVCHTTKSDGTYRKSCFYRRIDLQQKKLIITNKNE
jgi:phosphoribosyl-AMP cyclohydrolase